jgi:transcriptional regulator with XRE-family HTH domain
MAAESERTITLGGPNRIVVTAHDDRAAIGLRSVLTLVRTTSHPRLSPAHVTACGAEQFGRVDLRSKLEISPLKGEAVPLSEPDSRPGWARRIREERTARGWSQARLVTALRAHSATELPSESSMLRRVKSWEAGKHVPDDFYRPLIAKTFGTVTAAIWPEPAQRESDITLLAATGMDTLEIISRIRSSSIDSATLDGLRITVDGLFCEYRHAPPDQLLLEGRQWLRRITGLLDRRMTLAQHRGLLTLAGLLAALVGLMEYDMCYHQSAECTRRAALSLGEEAEAPEVIGLAHEMRAWFALTQGDYRAAIRATEIGEAQALGTTAALRLPAQRARAWARIGDQR